MIALGNSGTGKTHVALALGLEACPPGVLHPVHHGPWACPQLMEVLDEKRLLKFQNQPQAVKLLIIDELGYVPLSQVRGGAAVRGVLAAIRARLDHRHVKPAIRGMVVGVP